MSTYSCFYATNRRHVGADRFRPSGYGPDFSTDGRDNLRFGKVSVTVDDAAVQKLVDAPAPGGGTCDGPALADLLSTAAQGALIQAYVERSAPGEPPVLGSISMFDELKTLMTAGTDVVVFIHGFNVSWEEAVGSALALQIALRNSPTRDKKQDVNVVLFSWPSDGRVTPFVAYRSDRDDARESGLAIGRALLKLRDYLADLRRENAAMCGHELHLLCHSMGNYALQNALARMAEHTPGTTLPRLFDHVFLCAPDVDDSALEPGQPLGMANEITRMVTVYHNRNDKAMWISDFTKGNPERLGCGGAARPTLLHAKEHQVDCTEVVSGAVQHSYHLAGHVLDDIRQSIDGAALDGKKRRRVRSKHLPTLWTLR